MGQLLIVALKENIKEYLANATTFDAGFELDDFYEPQLLENEKLLAETIAFYKEIGLPDYCTLHGAFYDIVPFSYDKTIRKASVKRMRQSMDIARQLGVKGVVFHTNCYPLLSGDAYDANVIEGLTVTIKSLLEEYPEIEIYLENMFDADAKIMVAVAKRLANYGNFGLCLDYAHACITKTPIEEWVTAVAPYVKHLHINDNDLEKDLHLAVGEGRIEWKKFFEYYNRYFKDCSLLIEVSSPEKQRQSLKYMKKESGEIGMAEHTTQYDENMMTTMENINTTVNSTPYTADELLERIFYYVNELAVITDFRESIKTLTNLGRDMVNSERASFWYWDRRKKEYWTVAALESHPIVVPEGSGIVGASIQNNEVILMNHPYEDERFNSSVDKESGFVTKSILCIPVVNTKGMVIGAYQAINKLDKNGNSEFGEQDIKRLTMAAMFCGKTLESQILYEDAHMDQLTGLKNRRGFHEYYKDILERQQKINQASIIMCDIDFFKKVNDTYGHNAGDTVLVFVANMLRESVKDKGEVIRWGGEEFILLLPGFSLDDAVAHAEKLRTFIENNVCCYEQKEIHITMSFGVKQLDKALSADVNVELVDEKLYKAKTNGRNQVVA